jgi:hypothetical protein
MGFPLFAWEFFSMPKEIAAHCHAKNAFGAKTRG